jgi:WD40 repeat protein
MEAINCVAFSGNTGVAGYYDKILRVWELSTGVCKYKLWGHTKAVECVAIQDNIVLSGSLDNSVRVWDSSTGACLHVLVGHATPIRCVAIKGNTIISGSEDGELRIWDISTGIPISNDTVSCLAVTGNTVVVAYSGSLDKILHIWDISTGLCVRTLVGHTAEVLCITVTDKANIIVSSSSDNTLRVWDVSTGACLYILVGHTSPISSVAVVGNIVLSQGQSWDKTPLRIWELSTGVCLHALAHTKDVECVALAENAVISSNGNGLKIWDVKTGQSSHMLVDLDQSYIICIAAKTNMLVSGSARDKRLRVWDMATGVCLRKLGNYFDKFGTPMKIQFHPNPHWVVVFYDSGLLALWDIMQDTLLDKQQWPIVNTDEQHTITHSTKPHKYGRILYPISAAWNINKGYLVLRTSTGGVMCAQIPPTQYYNPDIPRLPPWQLAWTRPAPHLDVRDLQIDGAEIVDASTQALLQRGTRGKPR